MFEQTLLVILGVGCEDEEKETVLIANCVDERIFLSFDSCFCGKGSFVGLV